MTRRRGSAETVRSAPGDSLDLSAIPAPPAWTDDALCAQVDPDLFFPVYGGSTRAAKSVCAACPVQRQCLEYALAYEAGELGVALSYQSGIYGGLSERERRTLVRARRAARAAS